MINTIRIQSEMSIISLETKILQRYLDAVKEYTEIFSNSNYHLSVDVCWTVDRREEVHLKHPLKYKEYKYWISYRILDQYHNPIIYDDENSCFEGSEAFLIVKKKQEWRSKKNYYLVTIADDMTSVQEELYSIWHQIKQIK